MSDCPNGPYHFWEFVDHEEICINCGEGDPNTCNAANGGDETCGHCYYCTECS